MNNLGPDLIKSPLNYIGGKSKILNQILPLFPRRINNFVDLFAGGCNVGINVDANKVYFNDNLTYLIEMYKEFQLHEIDDVIRHVEGRIKEFRLTLINEDGYKKVRELYNKQKNPLDLFVLIAYSFNHQIRFNSEHKFNNPFGRERSSFNASMKKNLSHFIRKLKSIDAEFSAKSFKDFSLSFLGKDDFLYCDPPYLITIGSYNDGKRGFDGWTKEDEIYLLEMLSRLNKRRIKFALSNVLEHKGKVNDILKDWLRDNPNYLVSYINTHYANSNYQTVVRDKNSSIEVLITNYKPSQPRMFDKINSKL